MFVCIMVMIFGGFGSFSKLPNHRQSSEKCIDQFHLSVHTFNTSSFITTYFPIPFFAVLFLAYKFWNKSKMINYVDMDFVTGSSMDIPEEVRLNRDSNVTYRFHLCTDKLIGNPSNTLEKDSREYLIMYTIYQYL